MAFGSGKGTAGKLGVACRDMLGEIQEPLSLMCFDFLPELLEVLENPLC